MNINNLFNRLKDPEDPEKSNSPENDEAHATKGVLKSKRSPNGKISRRDFLKMIGLATAAAAATSIPGIEVKASEVEFPPYPKTKVDTAKEIVVSTPQEYTQITRNQFSDSLPQYKTDLIHKLSIALSENSEDEEINLDNLLPSQLQLALSESRDGEVSPELLVFFSENPNTYANLAAQVYKISEVFQKHSQQKVVFTDNKPSAFTNPEFEYEYRKPLNRYSAENLFPYRPAIRSEITAELSRSADTFGVPLPLIEAILLTEGGGGAADARNVGVTLTSENQDYLVGHNFQSSIELQSSSGARGPCQLMEETIEKFSFATEIARPGESNTNPNDLRSATAMAAAKIYVDALCLSLAEEDRYTPRYTEVLSRTRNDIYNQVSNIESFENLMRNYPPNTIQMEHFFRSGFHYHGTDEPYARLGNRSYDQFFADYYYNATTTTSST